MLTLSLIEMDHHDLILIYEFLFEFDVTLIVR